MRLNSSASAPSSSLLETSIRWLSEPEPILAAAAWIDSIGRTSLRASRMLVAMASSRNATSSRAVRQIADLSGAKASLSGCSTNTRQPSGLIVWNALSTFLPCSIAPDPCSVAGGVRTSSKRGSNLRQRGEARVPKDEVDVRVRHEFPV